MDNRTGQPSFRGCAFCGKPVNAERGFNDVVFARCVFCGAVVSFKGQQGFKNAAKCWNSRVSDISSEGDKTH